MTTILQILDRAPSVEDKRWYLHVKDSLEQAAGEWVSAVIDVGALSDNRAWALLSWIEEAATEMVRQRSRMTLVTAAFARSLLIRSSLDSRDIALVEALLHRGALLAGLNFMDAVIAGCERAGELGQIALTSLGQASSSTPVTHSEVGQGNSFTFRRRPAGFDVADLERWLEEGGR